MLSNTAVFPGTREIIMYIVLKMMINRIRIDISNENVHLVGHLNSRYFFKRFWIEVNKTFIDK